jgi:hypothetical protein
MAGAFAHACDRGLMILVRKVQRRYRGLVVVDGTKPVASRRQQIAPAARVIAALMTRVGGLLSLAVPGMIVGEIDAACGGETLGNGRPAFLRRANEPRELD